MSLNLSYSFVYIRKCFHVPLEFNLGFSGFLGAGSFFNTVVLNKTKPESDCNELIYA